MTAAALRADRRVIGAFSSRLTLFLVRLVVLAAAVAGWQLGTESANNPFYLPPSSIVADMYHRWFSGPASHLWLTSDATGNLTHAMLAMNVVAVPIVVLMLLIARRCARD